MGLIKSDQAPASVQPFSMQDVEKAARSILLRARRQAEELLATAQHEAEALKVAAHAEGKAEGFAQGRAEGLKQGAEAGQAAARAEYGQKLAAAVDAMTALTIELEQGRQQLENEALEEVVHLAVAIARRATKRHALFEPAVLLDNLSAAMRLAVHAADVRIEIHPEQRAVLEKELPRLRQHWPQLQHIALVDDATLTPGGCRVNTAHGQIDADLDEQLNRIVADLLPPPDGGSA